MLRTTAFALSLLLTSAASGADPKEKTADDDARRKAALGRRGLARGAAALAADHADQGLRQQDMPDDRRAGEKGEKDREQGCEKLEHRRHLRFS